MVQQDSLGSKFFTYHNLQVQPVSACTFFSMSAVRAILWIRNLKIMEIKSSGTVGPHKRMSLRLKPDLVVAEPSKTTRILVVQLLYLNTG